MTTITIDRAVLEQALEALDCVCNDERTCDVLGHRRNEYHVIGAECPAVKRLWVAAHNLKEALNAPQPKPIIHKHEWFRTGAMAYGVCRCIHCGVWNHEIDAQHSEIEQLKAERDAEKAAHRASLDDAHQLADQLEAERDALLETLRPFAALLSEHHERMRDEQPIFGINNATFNVGELRRAKAAIDAARGET